MNGSKLLSTCIFALTLLADASSVQELKLLHVLFSHKIYASFEDMTNGSIPRNLTYEHFNVAAQDMSNSAKLNMYQLGAHLRKYYDAFLGKVYHPEISKTRTTEYSLSMISGQLVNAGLWPPAEIQRWSDEINWQPVASDYVEAAKDTLLLGTLCPNFLAEVQDVLESNKAIRDALKYHIPLFRYVTNYTGVHIESPSPVARLYSTFETMVSRNISLPVWSDGIFPDGEMYEVALLEYKILSQNSRQKQLNGGTILKEIIGNFFKYANNESQETKLILYSGDERNIVGVLECLDLWSPHIPDEAAALLFELYFNNETDTYGIKIKYYTGVDGIIIPLIMPSCGLEICPLEIFNEKISDVIPSDEESLCGHKSFEPSVPSTTIDSSEDTSSKYNSKGDHFIHCEVILLFFFVTQYSTFRAI